MQAFGKRTARAVDDYQPDQRSFRRHFGMISVFAGLLLPSRFG